MATTTFKPGIEKEAWFPEWKRLHFPELSDAEPSPAPAPKDEPPAKGATKTK